MAYSFFVAFPLTIAQSYNSNKSGLYHYLFNYYNLKTTYHLKTSLALSRNNLLALNPFLNKNFI